MFKEKILQYVAETSNNIFKSLRGKGKITENQLKYFTIAHKKATNLRKMYLLSKIHKRHFNAPPSRQILVLRTPRGRAPPTSQGRSLKILFDPRDVTIWRPGDVPIWRPGDVLIWRSRDVPGRLIWDVPRTFKGRPLEDLESTQTWVSKFFKLFFQNLFYWLNLKAFQHSRCIENPVKLLRWSIFCKIS